MGKFAFGVTARSESRIPWLTWPPFFENYLFKSDMWNPSFVLVTYKQVAILLTCFTVVFADDQQDLQDLEDIAGASDINGTACDKCLDVIHDDCVWNKGSKTDFHYDQSGICPCPGDNTKEKCNVVLRRIRNIPALQAWSACLFLLSICIAGKIHRIIWYCQYHKYALKSPYVTHRKSYSLAHP